VSAPPHLHPRSAKSGSLPQCGAGRRMVLLQTLRQCPYCTAVLLVAQRPKGRECFAVLICPPPKIASSPPIRRRVAANRPGSGLADADNAGDGPAMAACSPSHDPEIETLSGAGRTVSNPRHATVHGPLSHDLCLLPITRWDAPAAPARNAGVPPNAFFQHGRRPPRLSRTLGFSRPRPLVSASPSPPSTSGAGLRRLPGAMEMEAGARGAGAALVGRRQLLESDVPHRLFRPASFRLRLVIFRPFTMSPGRHRPMGSGLVPGGRAIPHPGPLSAEEA